MESRCGRGETQCRSGECIRDSQFCDGRRDCRDGSDEMPNICLSKYITFSPQSLRSGLIFTYILPPCKGPETGVIVIPNSIRVPAWQEFQFICAASTNSRAELVFTRDRQPVSSDPRFTITRLNENIIQVTAPMGLRGIDDTNIE